MITAFLDYVSWNGFGIASKIWVIIMMVVVIVVGGLVGYYRQDFPYLLVLIKAFIGIGVEQSDMPLVANAAYLAAGIMTIFVVLFIVQKLRQ
jgi:hypothetical protein